MSGLFYFIYNNTIYTQEHKNLEASKKIEIFRGPRRCPSLPHLRTGHDSRWLHPSYFSIVNLQAGQCLTKSLPSHHFSQKNPDLLWTPGTSHTTSMDGTWGDTSYTSPQNMPHTQTEPQCYLGPPLDRPKGSQRRGKTGKCRHSPPQIPWKVPPTSRTTVETSSQWVI